MFNKLIVFLTWFYGNSGLVSGRWSWADEDLDGDKSKGICLWPYIVMYYFALWVVSEFVLDIIYDIDSF